MNQRQRDFLLNKIDQKYRDERDALEEMRPELPSLNNYLIAAFLDGTIKFQNMEQFKKKFIERTVPNLNAEEFQNFVPLLSKITELISLK